MSVTHKCKSCEYECDCDMNADTCVECDECQFNFADDDISEYDRLPEWEQQEIDQRESFNDRLEMFRNEY